MFAFTAPPMEYDPSTGVYRAAERFSSLSNLALTLLIGLIIFGFASHVLWIGAGVLIVLMVAFTQVSRRRKQRAAGQQKG